MNLNNGLAIVHVHFTTFRLLLLGSTDGPFLFTIKLV